VAYTGTAAARLRSVSAQRQVHNDRENVVSAPGRYNEAIKIWRYLIREAGFTPQQRDILYRHVNRKNHDRRVSRIIAAEGIVAGIAD